MDTDTDYSPFDIKGVFVALSPDAEAKLQPTMAAAYNNLRTIAARCSEAEALVVTCEHHLHDLVRRGRDTEQKIMKLSKPTFMDIWRANKG